MRQLRRQGWFAWIGLAALAIQLAAAFGHHHDHDHAPEHNHAYAHAQGADAVLAAREHSSHSHHHGDEVQPDKTLSHAHNQNDHDHDHDHDRNHRHDDALHCGVCWAMGPGAGGIIPAVFASVLPIDQDERAFVDPPQEALTGFKSARANRARAPPAPRHC